MSTKKRKPPRVRLAESGAPSQAQEEAIEARLDELFLRKVEADSEPLTDCEREAMKRRIRYRKKVSLGASGPTEEGDAAREVEVVPPDHYADLKECGKFSPEEIRDLAVELRHRQPGHAHGYAPSLPVPTPTQAPPGSEEKIRVMAERYQLRQSLHHPQDNTLQGGIFAGGLLSRTGGGSHGDDD